MGDHSLSGKGDFLLGGFKGDTHRVGYREDFLLGESIH